MPKRSRKDEGKPVASSLPGEIPLTSAGQGAAHQESPPAREPEGPKEPNPMDARIARLEMAMTQQQQMIEKVPAFVKDALVAWEEAKGKQAQQGGGIQDWIGMARQFGIFGGEEGNQNVARFANMADKLFDRWLTSQMRRFEKELGIPAEPDHVIVE